VNGDAKLIAPEIADHGAEARQLRAGRHEPKLRHGERERSAAS